MAQSDCSRFPSSSSSSERKNPSAADQAHGEFIDDPLRFDPVLLPQLRFERLPQLREPARWLAGDDSAGPV